MPDKKEPAAAVSAPQPARYTAKELAENAVKLFGVQSEVVLSACAAAGADRYSKDEAKAAIKKFLSKEVR